VQQEPPEQQSASLLAMRFLAALVGFAFAFLPSALCEQQDPPLQQAAPGLQQSSLSLIVLQA